MAKIVRKVSNKATKGQKREYGFKRLLHKKIFWIIASLLLVGIACAIILPIVLSSKDSEDTTHEHPDYFNISTTYVDKDNNEHEINFKKISYAGIIMETTLSVDILREDTNFNTIEYAFIFALDVTKFYPEDFYLTDEDEDDIDNNKKSEVDERAYNALKKLQYQIDLYNESHPNTDDDVALFIVDTSNSSTNSNSNILSDTKFGGKESDDSSSSITTMFSFYKATEGSFIRAYSGYDRGESTTKYKKYDKDKTDSGISIYLAPSNSIGAANDFEKKIENSISYLNNDFEDFEE